MRAAELQNGFGLESVAVTERPEPEVRAGYVKLKMAAWSLNFRDLMVVKGQYNPKLKFPFPLLSDGVGTVAEVGEGVEHLQPGMRVCPLFMPLWTAGPLTDEVSRSALGGAWPGVCADFVVVPASGVVPVPDHLTDAEAATLPCAAVTAWHAVIHAAAIKPGETVLIQGTGGVSVFALQFAKVAGARVIATSSSDAKLARVLELGADSGINYRQQPEWDVAVRDATDGIGVDAVVEVGGAGTLPRSLKAVRTAGTVCLIGVLTGNAGEINPLPALMKNIKVQGLYVGSGEMFQAMNRAIRQHQIRPVVDRVFPMAEIADAFRYLESARHFGKIVVQA